MRLFVLPISVAVTLVGLQLLAMQPVAARGWKHHMRDQYARQQSLYANPRAYGGYGASCNMPMNSRYGASSLPPGIARQVYGNSGLYYGNNNYGYGNQGFLRRLLGY